MPERSFGRTVRFRRTKLGLSQAKLGELVGRSTATVRSWERDKTRPNDQQVVSALAAVLGIDERQLFEKAEVERPMVEETSPTIEQVLASLSPAPQTPPPPAGEDEDSATRQSVVQDGEEPVEEEPAEVTTHDEEAERRQRQMVGASVPGPAYVAPPDPYIQTAPTPSLADLSYVEDNSQRQLYRVRNLATVVAVVILFIALIWAVGEGLGALGEWWDGFVGQLRL